MNHTFRLFVLLSSLVPYGKVAIITKYNKVWIRVTPLEKQPDPPHVTKLKQEIKNRWSDINLFDFLIESDFTRSLPNALKPQSIKSVFSDLNVIKHLYKAEINKSKGIKIKSKLDNSCGSI